jgi:hypothetical protein
VFGEVLGGAMERGVMAAALGMVPGRGGAGSV